MSPTLSDGGGASVPRLPLRPHCSRRDWQRLAAVAAMLAATGLLQAVTGCGIAPSRPGDRTVVPGQTPPTPSTPSPAVVNPTLVPVDFSALPGWDDDDVAAAFVVFVRSCPALRAKPEWAAVCAEAPAGADATAQRRYFESAFEPRQVVAGDGRAEGLLTGYYEPLLHGSRTRDQRYRHPLYAVPDDLIVVDLAELYPEFKGMRIRGRLVGRKLVPYFSRADIDAGRGAPTGRELAWVDDAVELFFLQVQGSGRIRLDAGALLRVGYADQNGHPYRSIGRLLVERGELTVDQASMQGIKSWGARNPDQLVALLAENPSYVFFRELPDNDAGPPGSLGIPLTGGRSLAVDPRVVPLGAPVFVDTTSPGSTVPLRRLMVAQDTGGAIKGPIRADFFFGFGDEAGQLAGRMRQPLRMWVLLPRGRSPPRP